LKGFATFREKIKKFFQPLGRISIISFETVHVLFESTFMVRNESVSECVPEGWTVSQY
jgi:hypothetical protein